MKASIPTFNIPAVLQKTGWHRLAKREQIMVGSLIVGIIALLLFTLIFSPLLDSRKRLQKSILKKQTELHQIRNLQQEYQALKQHSGDIQQGLTKRPDSFTLFSFIEQQANMAGIKENINYLKPSEVDSDGPFRESRVDMKLQKITLQNLVDFLKAVESKENVVSITRISIQEHGKEQGSLNAVIQLVTYSKQEAL
jgi:general secretion pathway protein M